MGLDERKGVWKSGKGKGRHTPKGRQLEDQAWEVVKELLGDAPRRRLSLLHLKILLRAWCPGRAWPLKQCHRHP